MISVRITLSKYYLPTSRTLLIILRCLCRQARDDDLHNIVTLAMHELNMNLDQSLRWVGDLHDQLVDSFLWTAKAIPSSGDAELDGNVMAYVNALGNCVRAHDSWCFEVRRVSLMTIVSEPFDRARNISAKLDCKFRNRGLLVYFPESGRPSRYEKRYLRKRRFNQESTLGR
jgi:hypothetical protein